MPEKKEHIIRELEEIAPTLASLKAKENAPANIALDLDPGQIRQRAEQRESKVVAIHSRRRRLRYLTAAAVVVGLMITGLFLLEPSQAEAPSLDQAFSSIETESLKRMVYNELEDLNEYQLLSYTGVGEEVLRSIDMISLEPDEIPDDLFEGMSTEELENLFSNEL